MFSIKPSYIHGLGVFLTEDVSCNTKLYDYEGEVMTWKEFTSAYGKYKDNCSNTYPMRRVHKIIVAKEEPYRSKNIVNYINEGLPNVILKNKALYSTKPIRAGEELLLQYPKDYKRDWLCN